MNFHSLWRDLCVLILLTFFVALLPTLADTILRRFFFLCVYIFVHHKLKGWLSSKKNKIKNRLLRHYNTRKKASNVTKKKEKQRKKSFCTFLKSLKFSSFFFNEQNKKKMFKIKKNFPAFHRFSTGAAACLFKIRKYT